MLPVNAICFVGKLTSLLETHPESIDEFAFVSKTQWCKKFTLFLLKILFGRFKRKFPATIKQNFIADF
jgi:hypothetical protein